MTTTVSGSGTISSPGLGSGIDVNSLVSQLIASERAPSDNQLNRQGASINGRIAAYNTIQSALTNLQSAEKALQGTTGAFSSFKTTSSDETIFTATASSSASAGEYTVEVGALATAHKLASSGFGSTATAIGTGNLTIGVGGSSFTIAVDSSNNTPAGLRDAINSATANTGVRASLITANDGVHLILSASQTGSNHAITVTSAGGDGGLAALTYDPANNNKQLKQLTAAGDASVSVDGYPYTSSSNQITDSIPGVTINLASASPGTSLNLSVASDTSGISSAVQKFVSAYNALNNVVKSYTAYNTTTNTASALTGDSLAISIQSQVRHALSATTPGATGGVRSLFDLGVSSNDDGTLSVDTAKLATALASNPGAASSLFAKSGALGSALQTSLDGFIGTNGVLQSRNTSLTKSLADLATQQANLNTRMDKLQALYTSQYTALDTLMSKMTATSTFLTNEFASLSKTSS